MENNFKIVIWAVLFGAVCGGFAVFLFLSWWDGTANMRRERAVGREQNRRRKLHDQTINIGRRMFNAIKNAAAENKSHDISVSDNEPEGNGDYYEILVPYPDRNSQVHGQLLYVHIGIRNRPIKKDSLRIFVSYGQRRGETETFGVSEKEQVAAIKKCCDHILNYI